MGIAIALDCMGGDHGAHVTVPAAASFVCPQPRSRRHPGRRGETYVRAEMKRAGLSSETRVRVSARFGSGCDGRSRIAWPCAASATRPCG